MGTLEFSELPGTMPVGQKLIIAASMQVGWLRFNGLVAKIIHLFLSVKFLVNQINESVYRAKYSTDYLSMN